jgi:hypothetical protein
MACAPTRPREWPELSWDQPSSLRGTERLQWVDMRPTRGAARGQEASFTCVVAQTFGRRLRPSTGRSIGNGRRSFIRLKCHLSKRDFYIVANSQYESLPLSPIEFGRTSHDRSLRLLIERIVHR